MEQKAISGIVLAGGKSSRMGEDKGWVEYNGKPLIEHSINSIRAHCEEILISANGEAYNQLPHSVFMDKQKDLGPIGGIVTTIPHAKNDRVLFTACDIPLLAKDIISLLISMASSSDLVYLQLPSGQIQPLPFIIHKKLFPVVQAQIEVGNYKLQDLISACIKHEGVKSEARIIEKEPLNINRPEDLK